MTLKVIYSKEDSYYRVTLSPRATEQYNLAILFPELVKEWHPTYNGDLTPDQVSFGSTKKIWWKCEKNHEWQQTPNSRSKGHGCPDCAKENRVRTRRLNLTKKQGSLADHFPNLVNEWHPTKNGKLNPSDFPVGSGKKVWWVCDKGHEYDAAIVSRTGSSTRKGSGCPFCAGKQVDDSNSLAALYPDVAREWHPSKNGGLTPEKVTPGSKRKVWWICSKNPEHEWEASVGSRKRGSGCPECYKENRTEIFMKSILKKRGSLADNYPELIKEWHPTKNGDLTPYDFTSGSRKKVWWMCNRGHEWKTSISHRNRGRGCPTCSPKTSKIEIRILTELETIFDNVKHGEIFGNDFECDIFIPNYNLGIEVDGYWHKDRTERDIDKLTYFAEKGVNFIRVRDRMLGGKIDSDIYYSEREKHLTVVRRLLQKIVQSQKISKKDQTRISEYLDKNALQNQKEYRIRTRYIKTVLPEQSLEFFFPDVAKEWDFKKNHPLMPSSFAPFSGRTVTWKCAKGHNWDATIATRSGGHGCPTCAGKIPTFENNFEVSYPELAKEWHPSKNGELKPSDFTPRSGIKVWWKCSKGHEWIQIIHNRTRGSGCPYCAGKKASNENNIAYLFPELLKEWHPTKNEYLKPRDFTSGSHKKVWWKCSKGHEWIQIIYNRTRGSGCPECYRMGIKRQAKGQTKLI